MRKIRSPHSEKEINGASLYHHVASGPRRAGERLIIRFYGTAAAVFLLDRIAKFVALEYLHQSFPVIPGIFHLTLVHNPGIAFGLFGRVPWLLLAVVTVSLVLILWMAHQSSFQKPIDQWVFGLILGGAFGNWLDRVLYGAVIDFFDFQIWPVFNVADSAISIGVGIYLIYLLRTSSERQVS